MAKIKVLLVEKDPEHRGRLRAALTQEGDVEVEEAEDLEQALEYLGQVSPHVIVVNSGQLSPQQMDLARRLNRRYPILSSAALSQPGDGQALRWGMALQPLAYPDRLLGEERHPGEAAGLGGSPLSQREAEILRQIAEGRSNKLIARDLNISHQTVKNHVTVILRKLRAQDRTHAVVIAIRRGWISLEGAE